MSHNEVEFQQQRFLANYILQKKSKKYTNENNYSVLYDSGRYVCFGKL